MAITSASGGFNGNFSPIIYSKQAQIALRKAAVTNAITNNSYFGEIANQGDTVRIQKEPDVTVNALQRHTGISVEKLDDSDFSLTIDKANYFAFKMDDIEEQFSNVDFTSWLLTVQHIRWLTAMDADVCLTCQVTHCWCILAHTTFWRCTARHTMLVTDGELLQQQLDATDFGNLTISATATAGDSIPLLHVFQVQLHCLQQLFLL